MNYQVTHKIQLSYLQHSPLKILINYHNSNSKKFHFLKGKSDVLFCFAVTKLQIFTQLINLKYCVMSNFDSEYLHL